MKLFTPTERNFITALGRMIFANPFLPERAELEREMLGDDYRPTPWIYSKVDDLDHEPANLVRLDERVERLAEQARVKLTSGNSGGAGDLELYDHIVTYLLYRRYGPPLLDTIALGLKQPGQAPRVSFWNKFRGDFERYVALPGRTLHGKHDPAYLLAGFFQVRRAFFQIYHHIAGASRPAARLRAAVWQSIFTHNMDRYFRLNLFKHMGRFPTLITGPSGTGKELVARAIGLSQFIPFDAASGRFVADFAGSFHALNLPALAPTLVESELFGHCKGAFTGAVRDQPGWLERCAEHGSVFLDEIGDLESGIQVKLLRAVQERRFYRLGDSQERTFHGKILAATHRNLAEQMQAGRFRQDLYYRLCADMVATPTLAEQLADCPEDLSNLIRFIVRRLANHAVEELAEEAEAWIVRHAELGRGYAWPGNFRELEQCVWNVLIRKEYHPARTGGNGGDPHHDLTQAVCSGRLSADELEIRYYTLVFAQTGNFQETARRLGRNWRTVKSKIDQRLLERLRQGAGSS